MNRKKITIIFDLDDTLYKEKKYKASGIRYVAKKIRYLYKQNIAETLIAADKKKMDIWLEACKILKIDVTNAEQFKWLYRLHEPKIKLTKNTIETINALRKKSYNVAIFTEGRSYSQRMKLRELKLDKLKIYISDEMNTNKSDLKSFETIIKELPAKKYFYIGDNPKKDFYLPNILEWETIGLIGNNNVHKQNIENLPNKNLPNVWVKDIKEILKFIN